MAEGESGQAFHDVGTQEGIEEDQEGGHMIWIIVFHFGISFLALFIAIYLMRKADGQTDN